MFFCADDETYWSRHQGNACWFCGNTGRAVPTPVLTSQHGADADLAEAERRLPEPQTLPGTPQSLDPGTR